MAIISLIGSGKVATQLGKRLYECGHTIDQIFSRNYTTAVQLARAVEATAIVRIEQLTPTAGFYIVAIKDDSIIELLPQLDAISTKIIAHTSGTVSSSIFESYFDHYGVFYPLQTFSSQRVVDFDTLPFCIHANDANTLEQLTTLAQSICPNVYQIDDKKRASLHVAAVVVNNFSNYLFDMASDICYQEGVSFDILKPLILETVSKIQEHSPSSVQTGPAARQDHQTIQKHLHFLQNKPVYQHIYQLISEAIMQQQKQKI